MKIGGYDITISKAWSDGMGSTEYRVYAVKDKKTLIGYVNNWGASGGYWQVEAGWSGKMFRSGWDSVDTRRDAVDILVEGWRTAGLPAPLPEDPYRYKATPIPAMED